FGAALDRGVVIPLIGQRDVAAIPSAAPQLRGLVAVLAALRRGVAELGDGAVIGPLQDDVDHANGVGPIGRRSTVHQDVDAVVSAPVCAKSCGLRLVTGTPTAAVPRMSEPVTSTCSGTSWACAVCACASCWACAAIALAIVSNEAEPKSVASLDVF